MTVVGRQRTKYLVSDFLATNVAWFLFNLIRYYTLPYNYSYISLSTYFSIPNVIIGQLVFPLMMIMLFGISGYYNEVLSKSRVDELINTYGVSLMGSVIIFILALFNDNIDDRFGNYELILILWLLIGTITYIPRLLLTNSLNHRIRNRQISFNTLIVGTTPKALRLAEELENKYPHMGFKVVGFLSENENESEIDGQPVIHISQLKEGSERLHVHSYIIVHDGMDPHHSVELINLLFPTGRSIYITPDTLHFITMRPRTQMVSGEVLIDVSKSHIPASTQNIKRLSDIIVSAVALVVLSPVYAVLALMVKKSSPGPIIYSQERIGLHQKPFNIYKFRTMYTDSESNGPALSSDNDPRITPIGQILRKYRLDELPQFWNVLKGDMSIVGPRPERAYYLNQIIEKIPYYSLLLQVRPGITSWGMVKYGYASSVRQMIERAKYDLLYIDNVSIIVDLKILIYTVKTVITGQGI